MSFVCAVCGETHDELPALAFSHPFHWESLTEKQREKGDLGVDFCVIPDEHYFIRCTLEVPIQNGPVAALNFGIWVSVSKKNARRYLDAFDDGDQSKLGSMFGFLANEFPEPFGKSLNLKCEVWPQDDHQRPIVRLESSSHDLSIAQRDGISFEKAHKIVDENA